MLLRAADYGKAMSAIYHVFNIINANLEKSREGEELWPTCKFIKNMCFIYWFTSTRSVKEKRLPSKLHHMLHFARSGSSFAIRTTKLMHLSTLNLHWLKEGEGRGGDKKQKTKHVLRD
ncbi:hypothetical protein GDO78_008775 [Eleutherodactylus coqui]|uniref:Uncharacterized protein n=1 Tax=Eleutherodactylus coqui TaxID=57060 RepID=A0A8J6FF59_ELECQ|nr:hypothetical protein GDO78_008775 [Eleutherodactylus coqui]